MLGHWGHVGLNLCVSAGERVSAAPTLARACIAKLCTLEVLPTCVGPAIIPDSDQLTVFTAQIYISALSQAKYM